MNRFLALAFFLFALTLTRWVAFDDDEFQHAHMSVLVGRGQVPHVDFFEHHLPLYHLIHSPHMASASGPGALFRLRSLSAVTYVVCLLLSAAIIRLRTGTSSTPVLLLVGLNPVFLIKMIEARPESLGLTFGMAAFWLLSLEKPKPILAGLLGCAMVLCSQKFIFLAAGLSWVAFAETGVRSVIRLALGALIPAAWYVTYLLVTQSFGPAWEQLVMMNLHWKETFSPWMYGSQLWQQAGVLLGFGLWGLLTPTRSARADKGLLLAGVSAVFLVPIPFRQTWLMIFPGLVPLAARGWQACDTLFAQRKGHRLALITLTLCGLLPSLAALSRLQEDTLSDDVTLMQSVSDATQGPVFDGRGLIFWRDHVGYYAWLHHGLSQMLDPDSYSEERQQALIAEGYPPILMDYRTELFPESLQTFINNHYLATELPDLWQPGFRLNRADLAGQGTTVNLPTAGNWLVTWTGGQLFVAGDPLTSGQVVTLPAGQIQISGQGFIRNAQIIRQGITP